MATLAQLQTWRDQLVKARATGIKRVDYDGYVVTYRDDDQVARVLRDLERRIEQASGTASSGPIRVQTSKGV